VKSRANIPRQIISSFVVHFFSTLFRCVRASFGLHFHQLYYR
jgi:hypothetical protein